MNVSDKNQGQQIPKRHHYVPQMLLRRFCDVNGNLYFFDKRICEKGVLKSTPPNLFYQKHLYSLVDENGSKDASLEREMSVLEGRADRVIEKIITAARSWTKPHLSNDEKNIWDKFLYLQWKRVPDSHRKYESLINFEESLRAAAAEFERAVRPLTDDERMKISDPEVQARIKQNARVKATASAGDDVVETLAQKSLLIAMPENKKKSFVIGSFSFVQLEYAGSNAGERIVQAWLPVASDVAVTMVPKQNAETLAKLDDRNVRRLNEAIFAQSMMVAGRSLPLIRSLSVGTNAKVD